jgi:hypothetical protein
MWAVPMAAQFPNPVMDIASAASQRCSQPEWARQTEVLAFAVGGRVLGDLRLNALTLAVPFTRLESDSDQEPPPIEGEVWVVPAQPITATPPRLTVLPGAIRYVQLCENRYLVGLNGTFAEYLKKFSAKQRYNLARTVRKFAEFSGGQIRWREFPSAEELSEFYRLAGEVSPLTWQAKIGKLFLRQVIFQGDIRKQADQGLAKGYVLFHRERPVAYVFALVQDDHLVYSHVGYDPEYGKWSPGTILLYLMLERLFTEGEFRYLDFGSTDLHYKAFFSTDSHRCARILYFPRRLRNYAIAVGHLSLETASVTIGKVLGTLGLKGALKGILARNSGTGSN